MPWDYDKEIAKRQELQLELCENLKTAGLDEGVCADLSAKVLETAIKTTPPELPEPATMVLVTAHSFGGAGGGTSRKLGNIRLDIARLMEAAASGVFTVISSNSAPWTIPFAGVLLWNSLSRSIKIDLTENEVAVLWTLWQLSAGKRVVDESETEILTAVNLHLKKYDRGKMKKGDLVHSISKLNKIGSIKRTRDGKNWFVCEWIRVKYS